MIKSVKETKADKPIDSENIIAYALSDPKYVEMGWTVLPSDDENIKLVTYQTEPAKPHFVWFKERTQEEKKYYNNGKLFVIFKIDGTGKVLYPDGQLAIKVSKHGTGTRLIALNPSGKDDTGMYRQKSLAAMFDSFGNGIIYDLAGKVRLKYSQKEGILLDTPNGLPVYWQWKVAKEIQKIVASKQTTNIHHKVPEEVVEQARHLFEMRDRERIGDRKSTREVSQSSKEIPISQVQIMTTGSSNIAQTRSSVGYNPNAEEIFNNAEEITTNLIETSAPTSGTSKKKMKFVSPNSEMQTRKTVMFASEKYTPIKTIVLKINKSIAFRILDQSNISIHFNAGNKMLRVELGVQVNPHIEVCVNEVSKDTIPVKDVPCIFELSPTPSLKWSQKLLQKQRQESEGRQDLPVMSRFI